MRKPFLSYFRTKKDHRINRKKRHPLKTDESFGARNFFLTIKN